MIGPQKGPTPLYRIKAQWKSIDRENQEAKEIRREWMTVLGMSEEEIERHLSVSFDLTVEEELDQLSAALELIK